MHIVRISQHRVYWAPWWVIYALLVADDEHTSGMLGRSTHMLVWTALQFVADVLRPEYKEGQMRLRGGIFDVDGVLLATPHEHAWRVALDQLMAGPWQTLQSQTTYRPGAFTSTVYQDEVAGKPRQDGAKAALAFFGVPDLDGSRAREYAERKQQLLLELAQRGEFHVYDDAVHFLLAAKAAGIGVCTASSSKNADMFLHKVAVGTYCREHSLQYAFVMPTTTLLDLFDADVNGWPFTKGKPDPEIFLTAARQLGYPPEQCFVVEDAPAGIEAARAGGMLGIGVARHHDEALLRAARADIVVSSLDAVDVDALVRNQLSYRAHIQ